MFLHVVLARMHGLPALQHHPAPHQASAHRNQTLVKGGWLLARHSLDRAVACVGIDWHPRNNQHGDFFGKSGGELWPELAVYLHLFEDEREIARRGPLPAQPCAEQRPWARAAGR